MNYKIISRGKPRVCDRPAHVVAEGDAIVAFEIEMKSKWCEVDATLWGSGGELSVFVGPTDRSCFLDKSQDLECTEIAFPDHHSAKWDIFVAECNRYILRVVLVRRETTHD